MSGLPLSSPLRLANAPACSLPGSWSLLLTNARASRQRRGFVCINRPLFRFPRPLEKREKQAFEGRPNGYGANHFQDFWKKALHIGRKYVTIGVRQAMAGRGMRQHPTPLCRRIGLLHNSYAAPVPYYNEISPILQVGVFKGLCLRSVVWGLIPAPHYCLPRWKDRGDASHSPGSDR